MRTLDTIRAGELRSRVTFKIRPGENVQDSAGGPAIANSDTNFDTWETRATVWGKIEMNRGTELREGNRDVSELYETLSIRYDSASFPDVTDAVLCDGRVYEIRGRDDVNRCKRLVEIIICEIK